ncbi:22037_t:CDS:2, partial [Gigaspora margarita]
MDSKTEQPTLDKDLIEKEATALLKYVSNMKRNANCVTRSVTRIICLRQMIESYLCFQNCWENASFRGK